MAPPNPRLHGGPDHAEACPRRAASTRPRRVLGERLRPKQTVGALAGAGAGGLLGAQIGEDEGQLAATAAGTLLGAFVGSEVGQSLDRADQLYASRASYDALEYAPSVALPLAEPGQRPSRQRHPAAHLPEHGRRILPRVPAAGGNRRRGPGGLWHRLPPAGRPVAAGRLSAGAAGRGL